MTDATFDPGEPQGGDANFTLRERAAAGCALGARGLAASGVSESGCAGSHLWPWLDVWRSQVSGLS